MVEIMLMFESSGDDIASKRESTGDERLFDSVMQEFAFRILQEDYRNETVEACSSFRLMKLA